MNDWIFGLPNVFLIIPDDLACGWRSLELRMRQGKKAFGFGCANLPGVHDASRGRWEAPTLRLEGFTEGFWTCWIFQIRWTLVSVCVGGCLAGLLVTHPFQSLKCLSSASTFKLHHLAGTVQKCQNRRTKDNRSPYDATAIHFYLIASPDATG